MNERSAAGGGRKTCSARVRSSRTVGPTSELAIVLKLVVIIIIIVILPIVASLSSHRSVGNFTISELPYGI